MDIYNPETKKITIISKIEDGGYWHVFKCLRILTQIERTGILRKNSIYKQLLVRDIIMHDVGKVQPALQIGDVVV